MALTKTDIVQEIQTQIDSTRYQSQKVTEAVLDIIKSSLESGEDVMISGFGKFCLKEKAERRGRNPATGEEIVLPARRVVIFKCSGKLREKVNGK